MDASRSARGVSGRHGSFGRKAISANVRLGPGPRPVSRQISAIEPGKVKKASAFRSLVTRRHSSPAKTRCPSNALETGGTQTMSGNPARNHCIGEVQEVGSNKTNVQTKKLKGNQKKNLRGIKQNFRGIKNLPLLRLNPKVLTARKQTAYDLESGVGACLGAFRGSACTSPL